MPEQQGVIKADAFDYLNSRQEEYDEIRSKNMLEHITEIGNFFSLAYSALKKGGKLTVITDNAEFVPYYFPFIHRYGIGAHSSNKYIHNYRYKQCTYHYALFTKLHLQNLLVKYKFKDIRVRRTTFGARLEATATK
jgi:cyclopropane fatty-acyl-phospholipid synthase-like methyltransferase